MPDDIPQLELEQIQRIYARLFDTPDGMIVLRDLRKRTYMDEEVFVIDDAENTPPKRDGKRSVFIMILRFIKTGKRLGPDNDEQRHPIKPPSRAKR